MKPVELIVIGAGSRGYRYATYALEKPELARVVAVAEPRQYYRDRLVREHKLPPENIVDDWEDLLDRPKFADAVIVATPDTLHLEPALAFAEQGYHILLEKPMAPDPVSCRMITTTALRHNIILAVCHVMRYTTYTIRLKQLLDSGLIGDIISIQHLEPVGFWHYAHSFVRGNWHNQAESSFMLLAKSCHDIDWLRYMIGSRASKVSSFGSLRHFRRENKPVEAGNATRCLDCAYEPACPYSASRFYFGRLREGDTGWPLDVITSNFSEAGISEALRYGPYGRCVYESDNDVVDHQVVNLEYTNGVTASFTMIGTSETRPRETIIFGSRGEIRGDGTRLFHYDFLSGKTSEIQIDAPPATRLSGHGGGDYGLIQAFVRAVAERNPSLVLSGPSESLETHLTVFAAEQARLENKVIEL